ncbi:MAG: molybdopterin-dependent oxidoreductase [Pseudomonadota bacterium]
MSLLSELKVPAFRAGGLPQLPDDQWTLKISGLVEEPQEFSLAAVMAWPGVTIDARLTSVSGWSVRAPWRGAPWREVISRLRPQASASHATFISQGGVYDTTLGLADLDHPRVLLTWGVGEEPLERLYGGPLRMIVPHFWGYKSAKWLAEIRFGQGMRGGYWEDRGYTREGKIEPGSTIDYNTGQRRAIAGGEVLDF